MSLAELRLTYAPDDEWIGKIKASVTSGAFSGQSAAWFDRGFVKTSFVLALKGFPLSQDCPPTLEGGFGSKERQGELDQCHLRVVVVPYGNRGTLLVRVELASEVWKTPDQDKLHTVSVRFTTHYSEIGIFADQLDEMLDGKRGDAVLRGFDG